MNTSAFPSPFRLAFIGGGNMARAMLGGLLRQGLSPSDIDVVEPVAAQREALAADFKGLGVHPQATAALAQAHLVVWAVKPQSFRDAALACAAHTPRALHLSVAAGVRTDSMVAWLGSERIVRAMPNTPALIGLGMTGLYARPAATAADRRLAQSVAASVGQYVWLPQEADLDAVTALSGSGPAYVFYFLEAMRRAGTEMGLSPETATALATGTFVGAAQLAQASQDPPEVLRERVTSKGGTTYAALCALAEQGVAPAFVQAMHAAHQRAQQLGEEFGR